jgi:hypothetical protein
MKANIVILEVNALQELVVLILDIVNNFGFGNHVI